VVTLGPTAKATLVDFKIRNVAWRSNNNKNGTRSQHSWLIFNNTLLNIPQKVRNLTPGEHSLKCGTKWKLTFSHRTKQQSPLVT
jgi:hypothetical protein